MQIFSLLFPVFSTTPATYNQNKKIVPVPSIYTLITLGAQEEIPKSLCGLDYLKLTSVVMLIESTSMSKLKKMKSTKIIMTLWLRSKKPVKSAITLDLENVESAKNIVDNTGDNYIRVEMPFKSLITEFFPHF